MISLQTAATQLRPKGCGLRRQHYTALLSDIGLDSCLDYETAAVSGCGFVTLLSLVECQTENQAISVGFRLWSIASLDFSHGRLKCYLMAFKYRLCGVQSTLHEHPRQYAFCLVLRT